MASFGWSFGDVIAGIKVVWTIYEAVSDGPLNAQFEATQFFDEFGQIMNCLDRWRRKAESDPDDTLSKLHEQLRGQCQQFLRRHMVLIQEANPRSKATREGRSTWIRRVEFSREQVVLLYKKVEWPTQRKEVARLRRGLTFFLDLSTNNMVMETNENMKKLRDLHESNRRLVNSHLDVVQSIAKNLELLTNNQLDHSLLQQFRRAIDPPPLQSQAIGAIEAAPSQAYLPWRPQRLIDEDQYASASSSSTSSQDVSVFGQDERLLQERLENIPKRVLHPQTNGTRASDLAYRPAPLQRRDSVVQPVLERLREIRTGFGEVFGLPSEAIPDDMSSALADAQSALQEELDIWNQLEHRIQYDLKRRGQLLNMPSIRHEAPAVEFVELPAPALPPPLVRRNTPSLMPPPSQPIPIESSSISPNTSPSASPLSSPLLGSSYSSGGYIGSPDSNRYLSSSNSSSSGSQITRVNPIPMTFQHQNHTPIQGFVQSISKLDDGEAYSVTVVSRDGKEELRHSIDRGPSSAPETSMKPFLDNGHIDKRHRFRVQFQGSHIVRRTKRGNPLPTQRGLPNPVYQFSNQKDYLDFQCLLLGKDVKLCTDFDLIKTPRELQCRYGTVSILVEPLYRSRSILYFRSKTNEIPSPAFVEWPADVFKEPREPGSRDKKLTLDSADGKSLSLSRTGLSRRSTQGSVTTIGSFESAGNAYARIEARSGGRGVRSLVIEFHEAKDCHEFWKEFIKKEDMFADPGFAELPTGSNISELG